MSKINAILDKLPVSEAIEVYHAAGQHQHQRIEASIKEAEIQKSKLKNKE